MSEAGLSREEVDAIDDARHEDGSYVVWDRAARIFQAGRRFERADSGRQPALVPGRGSRMWMRGWGAGLEAAFQLLRDPQRGPHLTSVAKLDDAAERAGLLRPLPDDLETQLAWQKVRNLEAELVRVKGTLIELRLEHDRDHGR